MALEKDFQALNDFLDNKLSAEERKAFEDKLNQDSELKNELDLQQSIREGIKQARIAELKGMLNNIPVASIPTSNTGYLLKIGMWAAVTGIVATATYFYFSEKTDSSPAQEQPEVALEENKPVQEIYDNSIEANSQDETNIEVKKPIEERKSIKPSTAPVKRKSLEVYDPSADSKESVENFELESLNVISKAFVTSSIEVETNATSKNYNFHYMFKESKLLLFGTFDKNFYEILEFISSDKKTVVLYYKSNYYLLDINKSEPTQLSPIKNKALLKKLKEHRGN
jgi:hypothetical protein